MLLPFMRIVCCFLLLQNLAACCGILCGPVNYKPRSAYTTGKYVPPYDPFLYSLATPDFSEKFLQTQEMAAARLKEGYPLQNYPSEDYAAYSDAPLVDFAWYRKKQW